MGGGTQGLDRSMTLGTIQLAPSQFTRASAARPKSLAGVVGCTVSVGGVGIGEVVGVYVDQRRGRAIGLDVAGPGGFSRFLPWVAASFEAGSVTIDSALFLVDDGPSYVRLGAELVRSGPILDELRALPDGTIERAAVSASAGTGTDV